MIPFSRWRRRKGDYPDRVSPEHNGRSGSSFRDTAHRKNGGTVQVNQAADEPSRGFLWVDAVGGFLVCLSDTIVLGQAVPAAGVDVPILGDLSTRHARIRRSGESYVLEPLGPVVLNGSPLTKWGVLQDGDQFFLGDKVKICFRKPHPLSNTVRLDILSGHRTSPSSDGVLLMGTTCLLGASEQHHVVCRDWENEIVLIRGVGGKFRFRSGCRVELNGMPAADAGELPWNTRLSGDDFALTMERG